MQSGPGNTTGYAGLISTGIGAAGDAFGAYNAAKAEKQNYEFEANVRAHDARATEYRAAERQALGSDQLFKLKLTQKQTAGSLRAQIAGKGGTLNAGSHLAILQDAKWVADIDQHTLVSNTDKEVWALRHQALAKSFSSDMARLKAKQVSPSARAGASLISGASRLASQWYRLNPYTPEKSPIADTRGSFQETGESVSGYYGG